MIIMKLLGVLESLSSSTTGEDTFKALSNSLEYLGLTFGNLVSVTTNGVKSVIGLIGCLNTKMSELNLSPSFVVSIALFIDKCGQIFLIRKCYV